jgi:hypothetical protein
MNVAFFAVKRAYQTVAWEDASAPSVQAMQYEDERTTPQ